MELLAGLPLPVWYSALRPDGVSNNPLFRFCKAAGAAALLLTASLAFMPAHAAAQTNAESDSKAVTFKYSHTKGDKWHLTSQVNEQVLINGNPLYNSEILNKIIVEIKAGSGAEGRLWNRYNIAESLPGSNVYAWSGEFESEYSRSVTGQLSGIAPDAVVPAVRNVPVFPETPVEPGETWQAEGCDVIDLGPGQGIPEILKISFTANYKYTGKEEIDGRTLHVVEIDYQYKWSPSGAELIRFSQYSVYPYEIAGVFHQKVFWDSAAGRNYAEEGKFSYTVFRSNGESFTFRGTSHGKAVYAEPMDKKSLVDELDSLDQKNLKAEIVDEGVKISLDDINFYPDQPVMLPGQEEKLDGIIGILIRYPLRDIQVIGHTAYIPGHGDGQVLSEQRAETVARYILKAGVRARENVTIRGKGNKDPVADNSTEQGRRLNRRVEIVILEN